MPDRTSSAACPYCGEPKDEHSWASPTFCSLGGFPPVRIENDKRATDDQPAATVAFEEQHEKNMRILGLIRDDHGWALSRILLAERLEEAVRHVIADSPGTPETVKGYLRTALRGF